MKLFNLLAKAYLASFHIPHDYQEKILDTHRKLNSTYNQEKKKAALETQLEKLKELYQWGHKTKRQYLTEHAAIQREIQQTIPMEPKVNVLEKLAGFLKDIVLAWEQASQEHSNRMVSCLFETVWIQDKKVMAVTPRPEFRPFFDLQYTGMSRYMLQVRPRGVLASEVQRVLGNWLKNTVLAVKP